jgi:hypothetical protein
MLNRPAIPSGGASRPTRRVRLFGLLAVRDGLRYLEGCLSNITPHVDALVALDDGSSDGSAEVLSACPAVVELIRISPERPRWNEMENHRALVEAALRNGAEWAVCVDADERLEREFRARAERVIRRGRVLGCSAYAVRLRELWDSPDRFRVDGIWGRKAVPRLFRVRPDHRFDEAPLHGVKAPLQARRLGRFPLADLNLYHLGMLEPEDRIARRRRYELADPDARWQRIGYRYLTDTDGLRLRSIVHGRGWHE